MKDWRTIMKAIKVALVFCNAIVEYNKPTKNRCSFFSIKFNDEGCTLAEVDKALKNVRNEYSLGQEVEAHNIIHLPDYNDYSK